MLLCRMETEEKCDNSGMQHAANIHIITIAYKCYCVLISYFLKTCLGVGVGVYM